MKILQKSDGFTNSGSMKHQKSKKIKKKQTELRVEFENLCKELLPSLDIQTDDVKLQETYTIVRAYYLDWDVKPSELQLTIDSLDIKILACNFKKDVHKLWINSICN